MSVRGTAVLAYTYMLVVALLLAVPSLAPTTMLGIVS